MRFSYRSPQNLFTQALKEYCEDKLGKPVDRLKLDNSDGTSLDVEAHQVGAARRPDHRQHAGPGPLRGGRSGGGQAEPQAA